MKKNCLTGNCPVIKTRDENAIKLSEGSGGQEMQRLIAEISKGFKSKNSWSNTDDDGAVISIENKKLVFTTDSYVVTPIFFPGGNIGKIAFCGTVNDLAVMGAKPLGLSLSLVLEEGMSKSDLFKIIKSIQTLSNETKIPIVTGDTKVMEKGSLDKIIINTSGVGLTQNILDKEIATSDQIIVSGGIGEHGAALLAQRFEMISPIKSDSKILWQEINVISKLIKQAKDITRGGLATILNEIAEKNKCQIFIDEQKVPVKKEVASLTEILGLDIYSLACEGRFVCVCNKSNSAQVLRLLKKFNSKAAIVGEVKRGKGVLVQTIFGKKILSTPSGNIVPRIC